MLPTPGQLRRRSAPALSGLCAPFKLSAGRSNLCQAQGAAKYGRGSPGVFLLGTPNYQQLERAPPPSLPRIVAAAGDQPPLAPPLPHFPGSTSAADCWYSALTLTPLNLLCRLNTTPREEVLLCPRRSCSLPRSSLRLIVVACAWPTSLPLRACLAWTLRSVPAPRRSAQPLPGPRGSRVRTWEPWSFPGTPN